jgi:hypothetical protein
MITGTFFSCLIMEGRKNGVANANVAFGAGPYDLFNSIFFKKAPVGCMMNLMLLAGENIILFIEYSSK